MTPSNLIDKRPQNVYIQYGNGKPTGEAWI